MKNTEKDFKKLIELNKVNAELLVRPLERVIPVYKITIYILVVLNILLSCLFCYYIHKNTEYNTKITKNFTYSINKITKECINVKRSDVGMD